MIGLRKFGCILSKTVKSGMKYSDMGGNTDVVLLAEKDFLDTDKELPPYHLSTRCGHT